MTFVGILLTKSRILVIIYIYLLVLFVKMSTVSSEVSVSADLSQLTIGFLGCGKISSALCRGFAGASIPHRPHRILVSKRSEDKSSLLKEEFPTLVYVMEDNQEIVEQSDIIFIGLLPTVARNNLPVLSFESNKHIVSMMAVMNYEEVGNLVNIDKANLVRTVPLPSSARRCGPILSYPPNQYLESVLRVVGTPIVFDSEDEMKTAICVTGHISPFFELMRVTENWIIKNGVSSERAKPFISSFYSSLAQGAELSMDTFEELCHEAATPGGLNEQATNLLRAGSHYKEVEESLEMILRRLKGR